MKNPISLDVLLRGKKNPNVVYDESYTNLDYSEIKLAKESIKYFGKKMYITKDEDNKWMKWENKPELKIPINEHNPMYYEAKGEFESITEAEALLILSKIPIMVKIENL